MRAVILAGGLGTRIRELFPDQPKPLVPLCGRPFLEWQIEMLVEQGIDDIVLCVGYRAEQIMSHFEDGSAWRARIHYSVETEPRGTGGALRQAQHHLGRTALVLNGDTYFRADYPRLFKEHVELARARGAWASVCLADAEESSACGRVRLEPDGRVSRFDEKVEGAVGLVNAGAYFIEPEALSLIPWNQKVSLEREVFPRLAADRRLFGLRSTSPFLDMGTPQGHARLSSFLSEGASASQG